MKRHFGNWRPRRSRIVYGAYNFMGHLLYIGSTNSFAQRRRDHLRGDLFSGWGKIDFRKLSEHSAGEHGMAEEARLIALYNPPLNVKVGLKTAEFKGKPHFIWPIMQ